VTLEGVATGETSVRLVPSAGNDEVFVYDEEGTGYNITDIDGATATVTVTRNESQSGPPAIVDGPGRPTDPDGDGLYEDVDGDGQMSIIDVVKFLDVFDTPAVESNQAAFDFDGNGRATILDVVALLNRL
jgi:PKD repeat protein